MIINPLPRRSRPIAKRPPLRAPQLRPVDAAQFFKRFRRLAGPDSKNG